MDPWACQSHRNLDLERDLVTTTTKRFAARECNSNTACRASATFSRRTGPDDALYDQRLTADK